MKTGFGALGYCGRATGGFHIWPKAREKSEQAEDACIRGNGTQQVYVDRDVFP
jgi:hypothetical protein